MNLNRLNKGKEFIISLMKTGNMKQRVVNTVKRKARIQTTESDQHGK